MSDSMVRIKDLEKKYGSTVALGGISLEVRKGTIFGLLGPNGAGKTTTVKILATLLRPDRGEVEIAGMDALKNAVRVRQMISYIPQELTVDPYLTAREHLRYYAKLYHLESSVTAARIKELLDLLGLVGHEDRRVRQFSGGMKKKLDLACGLIHRPILVFLDEPSLGLDVHVRHNVWTYIRRLREEGTTVLLCTNYMDEAERLCEEVAIIDRGKIAVMGRPDDLKDQLHRDLVSVELSALNGQPRTEGLEALERAVARLSVVSGTVKDGTHLKIYVERGETVLTQVVEAARTLSLPIRSIKHARPGLDEVFLRYTGRVFPVSEREAHG
jgi:ABC-2 type transport system ATP-binding protein